LRHCQRLFAVRASSPFATGAYPQRFAQEALGHSSRAVHEAYAKGALVICPALDEYESMRDRKIVPMPLRAAWTGDPVSEQAAK
jgi:hypothetical protein